MKQLSLEELKASIARRMTLEEVLDICDISFDELLDIIEEYVDEHHEDLEDALY